MNHRSVAGRGSLRAGITTVFVLLLLGAGSLSIGQATEVPNGFTVEPDGGTPGDIDGDVGREPIPTEPAPTTEAEEVIPTATPDGTTGGEGVAPGTVTVVLWTSDGFPLPERATVCIGDVCQSAAGARSGVSFWFDKVGQGWQQVLVLIGAPYGESAATVEVRTGVNSQVEITLVPAQPQSGEIRDPKPTAESPPPAQSAPPSNASSVSDALIPVADATSSPAGMVTLLPDTGANHGPGGVSDLSWTLATLATCLLLTAAGVRRLR